MSSSPQAVLVPILVALFTILAIVFTYLLLTRLRMKYDEPKYVPTQFLKERWRRWQPRQAGKQHYTNELRNNDSTPTLFLNRSARSSRQVDLEQSSRPTSTTQAHEHELDNGVDRHSSVRSIMTLPRYSKSVRENEQVLGREGERDGIDVMVEAPETAEEIEDRREEEMDSIYQIRETRRREIAERDERRQRRREARARRDNVALNAIRQESIIRARERELHGASAMIIEHQSRSRERRVSSVDYRDVGLARHDGTRLRASSNSSDRQPLLDSAASISGQSLQPVHFRDSSSLHSRARSASSVMSGVSDGSDTEVEAPPFGRSGSDFEVVTLNNLHSRNTSQVGHSRNRSSISYSHSRHGSAAATPLASRSRASSAARPSVETNNIGVGVPAYSPPDYDGAGFEEAPPYVSPATEQARQTLAQQFSQQQPAIKVQTTSASGAPQLPEIGSLPSIHIAEPTPIEPRSQHGFSPT